MNFVDLDMPLDFCMLELIICKMKSLVMTSKSSASFLMVICVVPCTLSSVTVLFMSLPFIIRSFIYPQGASTHNI